MEENNSFQIGNDEMLEPIPENLNSNGQVNSNIGSQTSSQINNQVSTNDQTSMINNILPIVNPISNNVPLSNNTIVNQQSSTESTVVPKIVNEVPKEIKESRMKKIKLILILILVILMLFVGIYFIFIKGNDQKHASNTVADKSVTKNELEEIREDQVILDVILDEKGVPKFIDGTFTDRVVTDEDSALLALEDIKDMMKINNVTEEFIVKNVQSDTNITFYRFSQQYKGLEVYGSELIISVNSNGQVQTLSGKYIPDIEIDVNNVIDEQQYQTKILQLFGEDTNIFSTKMQIYNNDGENNVAYVSVILTPSNMFTLITDAKTGEILLKYDSIQETAYEYTGKVKNGKEYTITLDEENTLLGSIYNFHDPVRNITIVNASSLGMDFGTDDDRNYWNALYFLYFDYIKNYKSKPIIANMISGTLISDHIMAIDNAIIALNTFEQTYDYYKNVLGRDSYDGNGAEIIVYLDARNNAIISFKEYFNACWNGEFSKFIIGTNNGLTLSAAVDVTAHEFTHAVIQHTAGLLHNKESGALNESYADIMGSLIEGKNFTIGEDMNEIVRDMSNPNAYNNPSIKNGTYYFPTDKNKYNQEWMEEKGYTIDNYEEYDKGGVHNNSGVPNYAAYLMYNNGAFIDREQMAKVFYHSLFYLSENAQFEDCALAVLKSAEHLGLSEESIAIIEKAFVDTKMLEQQYFDLLGKATDENGKVLQGVKVSAVNTLNDKVMYTTYTSSDGIYSFTHLPKGIYNITYSKTKYEPVTNKLNLNEDKKDENVVLHKDNIDTTYCNPDKEVCVIVSMYELESNDSGKLSESVTKFYYKKGNTLENFGLLNDNGYYDMGELTELVNLGWYYRGTNTVYDWTKPVNENIELEMKIAGIGSQDMIDYSNIFHNMR